MVRTPIIVAASIATLLLIAAPAQAAHGESSSRNFNWELGAGVGGGFGLKLDTSAQDEPFGWVTIDVDGLTVAQISTLSFASNGLCAGGAPRAQVGLDLNGDGVTDKRLFVYGGDIPSFTCASGWTSHDLMVGNRWDSTQIGGPFYGDHATAAALAGAATVTSVSFVWDAYWAAPGPHVVLFDDLVVNDVCVNSPLSGIVGPLGLSCTVPAL